MDKYEKWFDTAWERLNDDFRNRNFRPQMESDIMCHLYAKLIQTKQDIGELKRKHIILTEYTFNPEEKRFVDLVIGKWGEKKGFEPRLAVEIKETGAKLKTGKEYSVQKVERKIKDDIQKMRQVCPKGIKKYVVFFFKEEFPKGISSHYEKKLELIKDKHKDIIFKWGPI